MPGSPGILILAGHPHPGSLASPKRVGGRFGAAAACQPGCSPCRSLPGKGGFRLLKRLAVLAGVTAKSGIKEPLIKRRAELHGVFAS